ncbi:hypothetical protein BT63DRAFT_164699 [Microthyrium microscopicum]|uniref:Uncharacterized protein n=1 Tax=Microthyrium microscopicum TaxID=703497 RepID=A0A6A6UQK5_9PEZI|nr:hypothetical protein BT63DRAFT_164699 [Microthyrium microscopicum]
MIVRTAKSSALEDSTFSIREVSPSYFLNKPQTILSHTNYSSLSTDSQNTSPHPTSSYLSFTVKNTTTKQPSVSYNVITSTYSAEPEHCFPTHASANLHYTLEREKVHAAWQADLNERRTEGEKDSAMRKQGQQQFKTDKKDTPAMGFGGHDGRVA